MLTVICFSKDRAFQLQAYLQSLIFFTGVKESYVTVIFKDSDQVGYDGLIAEYPGINWIREKNFSKDLQYAISKAENYILFGCDDVFFKSSFSLNYCIKTLRENDSIFSFSLRLGTNITGIPDITADNQHLIWDWTKTANSGWNYPWEVSGSIYRRSDVEKYLQNIGECLNPNLFEDLFYKRGYPQSDIFLQAPMANKLACFNVSKCLTLTINRVQDEYLNDFDGSLPTDILSLHQCFLEGKRISWESFTDCRNNVIHVGSKYYRLTDEKKPMEPKIEENKLKSPTGNINISLATKFKIFFYKLYIPAKEWIRPFIPRTVIKYLRNLVR